MKIGIDIGGSHIATGIVDENGKLLSKKTLDLDLKKIVDENEAKKYIIEIINKEIQELLEENKISIELISKIGISAPGNPKEGKLINLVNLHIKEFNIKKILEEKYKIEVKIKNDGKCAGIAEKMYGILKKYSDCVFLCIGTGVGSAVFLNNKLLEPKQNSGFELGHMIINIDGIECKCGKKGCFETYASMKRFKYNTIQKLKLDNNISAENFQNYVRKNIKENNVYKIVDEYLENVSIGISNIINIFEPQVIAFGGSFSYYEDIFLPILNEKIKKYMFNKNTNVKLVVAKLKNDAGIIGATEI